jgi:hypothetical protein
MGRHTYGPSTRLKPGLHRMSMPGPAWAGDQRDTEHPTGTPTSRTGQFAVLLREPVEAFTTEHGHEPTPDERQAIKAAVREANPELAWALRNRTTTPPILAEETTS